jgi:hypothetical protein
MATPTGDDRKAWRLAVFCLLWTMYGVSLFLPVTDETETTHGISGMMALTMGWSGTGIFIEMANVVFMFGTIGLLIRQHEMALVCGALGTGLGDRAQEVFEIPIDELRAGYFLWVATMVALILAAAFELQAESRHRRRAQ